jgi:hypothetical protein
MFQRRAAVPGIRDRIAPPKSTGTVESAVPTTKRREMNSILLSHRLLLLCSLALALERCAWSQEANQKRDSDFTPSQAETKQQLKVNWLYGAYVPKDVRPAPLTLPQRRKLFVRQTFITPGIYIRTVFLASINQAQGSPYEWGDGFAGYGRRLASNYSQTAIQNVFSTVGNAALGYEPRYDRCRCAGVGPRTKHALMRAFLTYNNTEQELRPQLALYGAAFGAGMLSSTWKPRAQPWSEGGKSIATQAGFSVLFNWLGEFAPEITGKLRKHPPSVARAGAL